MKNISRRDFFNKTVAVAAGCALPLKTGKSSTQASSKPKIRRYKPFGKIGFKVGDISAGAGQSDPALIEYLFECGINYIDTAYQYPGHEEIIGKVLPKWRDKIFVTTKWDPELVTATVTKAELLKALDIQLKRLNTTYVDCMMIHAIGHPEIGDITRIKNPAIYEAWEEAKKMGKVRFTGASSCGVKMLEEMGWGIENGRFEIITVGANFLTHGAGELLKKARAKGVATVAMKTMAIFKSGLNIRALMDKNTNTRQAVIKYILASDLFDTMIIGMRNYEQVGEYLSISGYTRLDEEEKKLLHELREEAGAKYCRPCCDHCYGTCPHNVPIWDILRYKMYFENYGEEKYAMKTYNKLPDSRTAKACVDCPAPCEKACPYKIPIRERLHEAHTQLTFA